MKRVPLKPGDEVKAGETTLTTIEPTLAPLLDPRARTQAEARVKMAEAESMRAKEALDMAKTAEKFALTNWERTKNIKAGSVSETDRDNAERDAEMKQREVRAAEFARKVAEFELEQARAALLQLDAPGSEAGVTIPVRSPVSGRVLKVMQESAMVVTAGTQILEVGDPADIEIEAEILSRDAVAIKPGADALVEQWGGDAPLKARVRRVEPAGFTKVSALGVEEQRVIVLSDLVNPPPEARALGDRYRVEVRVAVWHRDDGLLVPSGALFREGSAWMTFVYDNGTAKKMPLEVGRSDGRMTELLKGIDANVRVLLHPPDTVKDGVAVKPREVK
jgi:HlyD family secretion protein